VPSARCLLILGIVVVEVGFAELEFAEVGFEEAFCLASFLSLTN
jgi:hypothetical protein